MLLCKRFDSSSFGYRKLKSFNPMKEYWSAKDFKCTYRFKITLEMVLKQERKEEKNDQLVVTLCTYWNMFLLRWFLKKNWKLFSKYFPKMLLEVWQLNECSSTLWYVTLVRTLSCNIDISLAKILRHGQNSMYTFNA